VVEDEVEIEVFEVLGAVVEGDWMVDLTDLILLVGTRVLLETRLLQEIKRLRLLSLLPQLQLQLLLLLPPRRIRFQVSFRVMAWKVNDGFGLYISHNGRVSGIILLTISISWYTISWKRDMIGKHHDSSRKQ
jgi:hypothetical protein